jgi:GNAT superfamily N-acetyltransferase
MDKLTNRRLPLFQDFPIVCRPALPKDTEEVMELTRTIWDGHDYLPLVWADWLADYEGLLAVTECGGKVVGTGKLTRLSDRDWWLEGLRVHPQYQGRGIASHINNYLLDVWLCNGAGTIRLATASTRLPVQHLCERSGFKKIGEFSSFTSPIIPEDTASFTALRESEIPAALALALQSQSLGWAENLMDLGWQWANPDETHLAEAINQGRAWWWQGRRGLLVTWEDDENQVTYPVISIAACLRKDMAALLLDYRRLASKYGYPKADWIAPLHPDLQSILESCGFKRDWDDSIYIYARQHPSIEDRG